MFIHKNNSLYGVPDDVETIINLYNTIPYIVEQLNADVNEIMEKNIYHIFYDGYSDEDHKTMNKLKH